METKIINHLYNLFKEDQSIKKVLKGESLKKSSFKEVLAWYKSEEPWTFVTPDLIFIFDDYSQTIDDISMVAVEVKYFLSADKEVKKRWRQAFREIGQPLRSLLFGFNYVVLWHLFSDKINADDIKRFTEVCGEVFSELKLPVIYLATQISGEGFRFYKPWDSETYYNKRYILDFLRRLSINNQERSNPLIKVEKVMQRRKAIKTSLNIP